MRYVIDYIKDNEREKNLSVIRMEIDYELLSLHDAIKENDTKEIILRKERLMELVCRLKYLIEYV